MLPGAGPEGGLIRLTRACAAEYPKSRMCTSGEILDTLSFPMDLSGRAWIRPSPVAPGTDASGLSLDGDSTCNGWTQPEAGGVVFDGDAGSFTRLTAPNCAVARKVACCAVVP